MAGADYPTQLNGNDITPLEGASLALIFHDQHNHKDALIWEHEGNKAVRRGRWKLVCKYPGDWELYDVVANRTETDDIAAQHPDVVEELSAIYDAWAERCGVKPWDDISEKLRSAIIQHSRISKTKQGRHWHVRRMLHPRSHGSVAHQVDMVDQVFTHGDSPQVGSGPDNTTV